MRLDSLDLLAFGPFENVRLDFGAEPALELVFGVNEAGKSTALRAISGLFYGIPERTSDAHRFPMPALRIGAAIRTTRGEELAFVRRKGRGATLHDPGSAEPIDEARLERLLGGISETMFQSMFGLDYATLSQGAEALLAGRGEVGQSLFDAGGGRGTSDVLASLREECEALFKPAGKNQTINQLLARLKQARERVVLASRSGQAYEQQVSALEAMRREQAARSAERLRLTTERSRLSRLVRVLPILVSMRELEARLESLRDVPLLATDARERRVRAEAGRARAEGDVLRLAGELRELDERVRGLTVLADERAVLGASEVAELERLRGVVLGARGDLPRRRAELAALDDEADTLARELGRSPMRGLEAPRLDRVVEAKIERLRGLRVTLDERLVQCERSVSQAVSRRAALETRLGALPLEADHARLEAACARARREEGELGRKAALFVEREERAKTAEMRAKIELDGLVLVGGVPTEEHLSTARAGRDRLLALATGEPTDAAFAALARAIDEADKLADRLRRESERVSLHARLVAELGGCERARLECDEGFVALQGRSEELSGELCAWLDRSEPTPTPKPAATPTPKRTKEPTPVTKGRASSECAVALARLGELLDHGELDLAARKARARERRELSREHDERAREHDEAARSLEECTREAAAAAVEWAAALEPLGIEPSRSVEEVAQLLVVTRSIASTLGKARDLRRRIDGMERDAADLEALARRLAARHAEVGDAGCALGLSEELVLRHKRAHAASVELPALSDKRAQAERMLADVKAELVAADAELERLVVSAGAAALEGLARAEDASQAKRQLEAERATFERALAEAGDGATRDELEQATRGVDRDEARARLEELERTLEELDLEIGERHREIGNHESGLTTRFELHEGAFDDAQHVESCLAELRTHAEAYAVRRLASELLGAEIERYRSQNQGPVLAAANALFPRLTRQSFTGLRVEYRGDGAALVCVRPDGRDLEIEALSQGARDQLYLALRLATVLRFADKSEPMPLVLDDILVHFDDARSRAAFEVLFDVAERVQILFFTHHEHLLELARSVAPPGRLRVHRLG